MRRTEARQGVRMLRFMDVFGRWEASELSQLEAAELLGMGSGRSVAGAAVTRRRARLGCSIAGLARPRASGFRSIGATRWRRCIARAIRASRHGISMSTWYAITGSPGPRQPGAVLGAVKDASRRDAVASPRARPPLTASPRGAHAHGRSAPGNGPDSPTRKWPAKTPLLRRTNQQRAAT